MPEGPTFGGGVAASLISPIALCMLVLFAVLILLLPRKYMILPFLLAIFLIPLNQQIFALGVHWLPNRIVVLIAFMRLLATGFIGDKPQTQRGFTSIDRAVMVYILAQASAVVLLFQSTEALVNQAGYLIDALLCYLILRSLIQDEQDIYRALKCLSVVCFLIAVGMVLEQVTQKNIFGIIYQGFVAAPEVREGKTRSQGTFQHALMAGTFAGMLVPLFFVLWRNAGVKVYAVLGLIGCTLMTSSSNSSTPLLTYIAAILGLCLWRIRKKMRMMRWGLVLTLAGLAVVMKAPIWFLIARIDLTGSSSSYHRAELIDQFVHHFTDWWLIGVKSTADWGWDMWDTQNQYVNIGETGGLIAFVFFILVIVWSFRDLGNARKIVDGNTLEEWQLWCLGSSLFANVVGFFGVNYFDQSKVGWFLLLSIISVIAIPILSRNSATKFDKSLEGAASGLISAPIGIAQPVNRFPRFSVKQARDRNEN